MTEQAGDPFAEQTADLQEIADAVAEKRPTESVLEQAAEAVKDMDDAEESEAADQELREELMTREDLEALVKAATQDVEDCSHNLVMARKALSLAGKLQAKKTKHLSLAELNAIQKRVTGTETRRNARAHKALGELGFGQNLKTKPHPALFNV